MNRSTYTVLALILGVAAIMITRGMKKGSTTAGSAEKGRGYRNNNPLNIRISSNTWQGKVPVYDNTDGVFEQFRSMAYGFRAAMRNIRTYIINYGARTVQAIISKWAPPSENSTNSYITHVCQLAGFAPSTVIDPANKDQMCRLVKAMAFIENGYYITNIDNYINEAWSLYR